VTVCNACSTSFAPERHRRWRKDGFDIVQCPECGLLFRAALPTRSDLIEIYSSGYFFQTDSETKGQGYLDYVADEQSHRASARRRLDLIERNVDGRGRILDVGAAAGFFVDEARSRGWDALGVDVSEAMVEWGQRQLHVPLVRGEIDGLSIGPESLDVVTMWDYIEHSRDPSGDLRAVHRLLRPAGLLALSTGDVGAPAARLTGSRWHLLTPRHHNFFFSRRTLGKLLGTSGFTISNVAYPGARYPIAYLLHKFRTFVDVPPLESFVSALARSRVGRIAVPVNLRDIMTVVARKHDPASSRSGLRP
jgi:SAM-dependent methyltransferase